MGRKYSGSAAPARRREWRGHGWRGLEPRQELLRELEPLRKKGVINSTVATVVEAPEQK
jgi:hypothetical protein